MDALRALAEGRCLVAGFHVPPLAARLAHVSHAALKPLLKPGVHKLIGCMRRTQGLMLRPAATRWRCAACPTWPRGRARAS